MNFIQKTRKGFRILVNKRLGSIIIDEIRLHQLLKFCTRLSEDLSILDLGCGEKPYYPIFRDKAKLYIGIDWLQSPHPKEKIDAFADAMALPIENSSFDIILCTELLEHTSEPLQVLTEIYRILKKDGYVFISTPFMIPLHEVPYDYYRFTKFAIKQLSEKAHFKIQYIKPISELIGTALTFFINIELKFWYLLTKFFNFKAIYTIYNPFIFISIYLPQVFYLKILYPLLKNTRLNYSPLGYITLAQKF